MVSTVGTGVDVGVSRKRAAETTAPGQPYQKRWLAVGKGTHVRNCNTYKHCCDLTSSAEGQ